MFLNKLKIRSRIFWLMLISLLFSSVFIFQFTRITVQRTVEDYMYNYVRLNQENIESSITFLVGEMNVLSARVLMNNSIHEVLDNSSLLKADKQDRLSGILNNMMINKNVVGDIVILTNEGDSYNYAMDLQVDRNLDPSFLKKVNQQKDPVWGNIKRDMNGYTYILMGRKYLDFNTGKDMGYLLIYIKERTLYDLFKNVVLTDWGYAFLVADDANIISYPDQAKVGTTIFDTESFIPDEGRDIGETTLGGKSVVLSSYKLQGNLQQYGMDWKIISVISNVELLQSINRIKVYSIIQQSLTILLTILIAFYVSKGIIKPIKRIKQKIMKFGNSKNLYQFLNNESDELWLLEKSFNDMVIRINELIARNNEEKDLQRALELTALQAQINPHFLYNTLDAIGWMAKVNKQKDIELMIIALATFFRNSLHSGEKYVSVKDEISIIKSYVSIEAMRFQGKFEINYEIDSEILELKVLKIILQPLVENAIKHGISQKRGKGHIWINGYREGSDLIFEINDDGAGFKPRSEEDLAIPPSYHGGGYGLRNVNERIRLEYGVGYGVEIKSEFGIKTTSSVKVRVIE